MNRNRLPRWVNGLIDRIADAPMSPIGRLAARRLGTPAPSGTVAATTFDERPIRVLIAPVNYAGQGRAWAAALERADTAVSARNMAVDVPGGFAFDADLVVPVGTYHNGAEWQQRQFAAAKRATHVLIEAEEPPFGRLFGRSVARQAEALLRSSVNVAFLAHGTDVRLPSRHMAMNPWSHYADPEIYAPRAESLASRNIALLESSGRPVFVSTPDLLVDLPDAHWAPVSVDVDRWAAERSERGPGAPLRVVHAPSVGAVKGSQLIHPTLERLDAEGVIEYRVVRGVASADMPAVFAGADVVIDQLRIGSYGVAACEAMAAGCVVMGHVSDPVRARVRELVGAALPIVETNPDTIEADIRNLATRDTLAPLRADGHAFVASVHDGRLAARVFEGAWIRAGEVTHASGT